MADRSSSEQVMALNLLLTILVSENAYTSVKTLVEIWVARLYGKINLILNGKINLILILVIEWSRGI